MEEFKPNWDVNSAHPQKTNKILILFLILAVIILLIAVGLLYKNNRELKNNNRSQASSSPILANVPSGATFKGEPIDWEGGQAVDYFACESHDDCIKVAQNDCGCPYSDYYTAINKKHLERWQVRADSTYSICNLGGVACPSGDSEEECQNKYWPFSCRKGITPKCVSSLCKLVIE